MKIESWQDALWGAWIKRLDEDRVPHALLLSGACGLGKRRLARAYAAALLCESRPGGGSGCGECRNCTLQAAGTHPDVRTLEPAEDKKWIVVDQARDMIAQASLTSSLGRYQVFIIDPADRLNMNAANALLKTLEEPRTDTVMLLIAEDPARLPITIRSRCQHYHLAAPSRAEGLVWLRNQSESPDKMLEQALDACHGVPVAALQLLEGDAFKRLDETRRDLDSLRHGGDVPAVVARWLEDEPEARLRWMGAEVTRRTRELACRPLTGSDELASLTGFGNDIDRTRNLLESNLRPELLLEALLYRWQCATPDKGGALW